MTSQMQEGYEYGLAFAQQINAKRITKIHDDYLRITKLGIAFTRHKPDCIDIKAILSSLETRRCADSTCLAQDNYLDSSKGSDGFSVASDYKQHLVLNQYGGDKGVDNHLQFSSNSKVGTTEAIRILRLNEHILLQQVLIADMECKYERLRQTALQQQTMISARNAEIKELKVCGLRMDAFSGKFGKLCELLRARNRRASEFKQKIDGQPAIPE